MCIVLFQVFFEVFQVVSRVHLSGNIAHESHFSVRMRSVSKGHRKWKFPKKRPESGLMKVMNHFWAVRKLLLSWSGKVRYHLRSLKDTGIVVSSALSDPSPSAPQLSAFFVPDFTNPLKPSPIRFPHLYSSLAAVLHLGSENGLFSLPSSQLSNLVQRIT